MSSDPRTANFCLKIDFRKNSENPSRVFKAMTNLIERFEILDQELVHSISGHIKPILLLEDVETGSLKAWLKQVLQEVEDDALKNLDWKPQVGKYLVEAKYILINFLEHNTTISTREQIGSIKDELLAAAKETEVLQIPTYTALPDARIADALRELTEAISPLSEGDSVSYELSDLPDGKAEFNLKFFISPEAIEELLTSETITSKAEMILKIKKPDFLGESMWDFKHGVRPIQARIVDTAWLQRFQQRKEDVRPGDALRVVVETDAKYGYDGEVVALHHRIIEVKAVIPAQNPNQGGLF